MTDTVAEAPTLEQLARANAEWIGERLAAGDIESLQFLKFRPLREVDDVLAAARQVQHDRQVALDTATRDSDDADRDPDVTAARVAAALAANVVAALTDAEQLAKGHTGGPSTPPLGYRTLQYPVTAEEASRLLQSAIDAARMIRLPGADRGWTWASAVDVDPERHEVVIRLKARHPSLPATP